MYNLVSTQAQMFALAVAQERSFSRAADRLHLTQPALTRQIKRLEEEIGAQLFQRTTHGAELTAAGQLYISELLKSIRHLRRGQAMARQQAKRDTGVFRVAYSSHLASELLIELRDLQREKPSDLRVRLYSTNTLNAVRGVLSGKFHAGIGSLPVDDVDLSVQEVLEEAAFVALPKGHLLSAKPAILPEDVEGEHIVGISWLTLPQLCQQIDTYFLSLGIRLNIVAESASLAERVHLVSHGVGIALLRASATQLKRDGVIFRPLSDKLLTFKTGVFIRRDHRSARVDRFLELVHERTTSLRLKYLV